MQIQILRSFGPLSNPFPKGRIQSVYESQLILDFEDDWRVESSVVLEHWEAKESMRKTVINFSILVFLGVLILPITGCQCQRTGDAMKDAAEATGDAAATAMDEASENVEAAVEAGGEMMAEAGEAIGDAAEATGEAIGDAAEAGKEMAGEAMEATGEAVSKAGEAVEEAGEAMQDEGNPDG